MNLQKSQKHLLKQTSQRLKRLRKNKHLSQKGVAARCEMDLNVSFKEFFNFKGF